MCLHRGTPSDKEGLLCKVTVLQKGAFVTAVITLGVLHCVSSYSPLVLPHPHPEGKAGQKRLLTPFKLLIALINLKTKAVRLRY